jgi:hypothetical protein
MEKFGEVSTVVTAPETHPRCESRIRSIRKKDVIRVFSAAHKAEEPEEGEYLDGLYNLAYGFDVVSDEGVVSIKGFPEVNPVLVSYIADRAQSFEQKHDPTALSGQSWVENGFSGDPDLEKGKVRLPNLVVKTDVLVDPPVFSL